MSLFNENKFKLKKIEKIASKVEALAPKYADMDDDALVAQTSVLKERLANGENLDHILPDAYALVREASERVLGMRHFHVQIVGGIALHSGQNRWRWAPAKAKRSWQRSPRISTRLRARELHVVTVNDYLANPRRSGWANSTSFWGLPSASSCRE